jgi:hypothetical protein
LNFDAQKFKVLFIIGTGNAVGAQQGFTVVTPQANHGEMAVGKAKRLIARGGETEQTICPVMNTQDFFF